MTQSPFRPARRRLLTQGALAATVASLGGLVRQASAAQAAPGRKPMPSVFIGHGSPMNAIETNDYTQALAAFGRRLDASHGRPAAILVVSAHWLTRGELQVSATDEPETIHDFGGFPAALHAMSYPAKGAPTQARTAAGRLVPQRVSLDADRGLDHGAWTVLHHLYPQADVPVFQVSIDITRPGAYQQAVGRALAGLRQEGVLILGSGNVVHNLRDTRPGAPASPRGLTAWADEFDQRCKAALDAGDTRALAGYEGLSAGARQAVPFPDHYHPLLAAQGAAQAGERAEHFFEGFQSGTLSMRCVAWGA